jgi:hypothetical protein
MLLVDGDERIMTPKTGRYVVPDSCNSQVSLEV